MTIPGDEIIPVGFYTQVMGIGKDRSEVSLQTVCFGNGGNALDTFWRAAENYSWVAMSAGDQKRYGAYDREDAAGSPSCTWAVSQACPLRGCIFNSPSLNYATICGGPACDSSGGYSADNDFSQCLVQFMSQQQWCSVNDTYQTGSNTHPTWNGVFVDCLNAPREGDQECHVLPNDAGLLSNIELSNYSLRTPRRSKPFVTLTDDKQFLEMIVPTGVVKPRDTIGSGSDFWIASDECSLLDALSKGDGARILISSKTSIPITRKIEIDGNLVVLLGLGLPVLRILKGGSLKVSGASCVLAGVILEAGERLATGSISQGPSSSSLLTWTGVDGWIYDLFTRVGGAVDATECSCDIHVNISGEATVMAENLWLWRADHDKGENTTCEPKQVGGTEANQSYYGLVVGEGASLVCIGLASEHNLIENVSWGGSGKVFFYQSELVYCPPRDFSSAGFTIEESAGDFTGRGMGVYCYFPATDCTVPLGIDDKKGGCDLDGCVSVFLSGQGGIEQVVNQTAGSCPVCKPSKPDVKIMVSVWTKASQGCADVSKRNCKSHGCSA